MPYAAALLFLLVGAEPVPAAEPKKDAVTATCSIEPGEMMKGASEKFRVSMAASDSRNHRLAYVWSGEGGVIQGIGPQIAVDASGLAPGQYKITGVAQDAYRNRAECTVEFRITAPPDPLLARCSSDQEQVKAGQTARFRVSASGALRGGPRITWFSNGGVIRGAAQAELDTAGLRPAEYSVTARVEDGAGRATDCSASVVVVAVPPPPPPAELINLGQVVFPRNVAFFAATDRPRLEAVAERILALGKGVVSIEAYAGPDERDGQKLATARANSVIQLLVSKGVPASSLKLRVGLGGRLGGVRNRTLDMVWVPEGIDY